MTDILFMATTFYDPEGIGGTMPEKVITELSRRIEFRTVYASGRGLLEQPKIVVSSFSGNSASAMGAAELALR